MDKVNQSRILGEILENAAELLFEDLEKIPEEWDGIELRQWVADRIREDFAYKPMERKRKKNYKNERIVRNI